MNNGDPRITLEVLEVEAEELLHSKNAHGGNDSGVMDLDSRDLVN
jgi:hypothetical protein